jgi:hypothetical protein
LAVRGAVIRGGKVAAVAAFWLIGLACFIAALAGGGGGVKIGSVQMPGFAARSTRFGAAAVGVLALALGGVLFLNLDAGAGPASSAPGNGRPAGTTSAPTGANPGQGTGGDAEVVWHDTLTMADGAALNVGVLPIQVTYGTFQGSSIYVFEGAMKSGGGNMLSTWDGVATPSAAECANKLRTHPLAELRPRQDLRFCLRGNQGTPRIAYAVITSFDEATGSSEIDLTVWSAEL